MKLTPIKLGLICLLINLAAFAATPKKVVKKYDETLPVETLELLKSISMPAGLLPQQIADAKKREEFRGPADAKSDQLSLQSKISPLLNQFVEEFSKLSSDHQKQLLQLKAGQSDQQRDFTTELDQLIIKYESLKSAPNDLKFAIANLSILRAFRGYVWRLIPTVKNSKAVQSALITQVKFTINSISAFIPSGNSSLVMAYLTEPLIESGVYPSPKQSKGKPLQQFAESVSGRGHEVDVAIDFRNYVLPALMRAAYNIENIPMGPDIKQDYIFDLALIYGLEEFQNLSDGKIRYLKFGDVEKQLVLSQLYAVIGSLILQLSYTWDDSIKLADTAIGIIGMDPIRGVFNPNGVTSAELMQTMRTRRLRWGVYKPEFVNPMINVWKQNILPENLKNVRIDNAQDMAYLYLKLAAERAVLSYDLVKQRRQDKDFVVWNIFTPMNPLLQGLTDEVVSHLRNFSKGEDLVFISRMTGEKVDVSPSQFFKNPPSDLKRAFSIQEDQNKKNTFKKYPGVPEHRNYYQGRALKWDTEFYGHLFPKLKNCNQTEPCQKLLQRQTKILAESWTGFPLTLFFLPTLQ